MKEIDELTDDSPMPFGKYKGQRMEDVPADYLAWYRANATNPDPLVSHYIEDNWAAIQSEL